VAAAPEPVHPVALALQSCASTASEEAQELSVPRVYGRLGGFVPSLDAVLRGGEGEVVGALGDRTAVRSVAAWAEHFVSGWLNGLVSYLSGASVRLDPDEPAPRAVRALLRRVDLEVLSALRKEHHVDILLVLEPMKVDSRRMKISGVIGPDHTNVSGQVACGLSVGRRTISRAEVLVG
jgi:hypothetical protein